MIKSATSYAPTSLAQAWNGMQSSFAGINHPVGHEKYNNTDVRLVQIAIFLPFFIDPTFVL
jgi:hypothetical protein